MKNRKKQHRKYRKAGPAELVMLRTHINGQHKVAISIALLDEIKGKPWHWGIARISAITGRPFNDIITSVCPECGELSYEHFLDHG